MDPLVLTIAEAAEALRISERLTYSLVEAGVIPVVKLGSRRVVPLAELRQMLHERCEWDPEANPGIRLVDPGAA